MRSLALRVLLVLAGCALSLLAAEAFLRMSPIWIGRHSDTMFTVIQYDDLLGWRMKPSIRTTIDLVDIERLPIRSNSTGFRNGEFTASRDPHRCRLAFFGDSFTWGLGVTEEARFTNLLGASAPAWEALNFGMPGYGTDQALLSWRYVGRRYRPDVVVLTVYQNDYADNMYAVRYGRRKPYFQFDDDRGLQLRNSPIDPATFWSDGILHEAAPPYAHLFSHPAERRSRGLHWMFKVSDVARLAYTLLRASGQRTAEAQEDQPAPVAAQSAAELSEAQRVQVGLLAAIVGRFAAEVAASGARFMVVLAGAPIPQYSLQMWLLERAKIPHIDATTPVLRRRLAGGHGRVYYPYSKHWTAAAHRAVAEILAERIGEAEPCRRRWR